MRRSRSDNFSDFSSKDLPPAERVVKYKEEGNALLNKDTEKAIMWYSRAIATPHKVAEDRAVFFCNRAAAHLLLKNYRSALEDSESALSLNPSPELQLKALFRGAKAALAAGSGRLPQALKMCRDALALKKTAELVKLEEEIRAAIKRQLKRQDDKEEIRDDKKECTKLFSEALGRRGWRLGLTFMYETPFNDSKKIGIGYDDARDIISLPVILMYPQYCQSDLIEGCLETDSLQKWLEKLFPKGQSPLAWDSERQLMHDKLGELSIFCKTNDFPQNTKKKQKWVKIDPKQDLRDILLCDEEYVIPKWPVFMVVHCRQVLVARDCQGAIKVEMRKA
jgi:tetratricopeptide (TPR) repeat protein